LRLWAGRGLRLEDFSEDDRYQYEHGVLSFIFCIISAEIVVVSTIFFMARHFYATALCIRAMIVSVAVVV
jgi:hypothetical protein